MKKVKIKKSGGIVMKVTIELNRDELAAALDNGAMKALSMAIVTEPQGQAAATEDKPSIVPGPAPISAPSQPVYTAPAPIPTQPVVSTPTPVQMQIPTQAPTQPIYAQQPISAQAAPAVPTAVPTYTMDQLAVAATQLVDAGRRVELVNLLQSFNVRALTALPKEQYGAFATQLRAMGAKI